MRKLLPSFLLLAVMTFVTMGSNVYAQENPVKDEGLAEWAQKYEAEIRSNMDIIGIDKKTQDKLIRKLKNGQPLDSMKAGIIEADIGKTGETVKTFPDGSAVKIVVEDLGFSAQECGSGYCTYKRKIFGFSPESSGSFMAQYTNVYQGYDYITSVWDPVASSGTGTTSGEYLTISQKKETIDKWARAYFKWKWTAYNNIATYTHYLRLFVGDDTYSTNMTWY